jgi:uncharacterized protein
MEEKLFFSNSKKQKLCGILSNLTIDKTRPIIILCHGFSTGKDNKTNTSLNKIFYNKKISTFRFDFFGHGESEGKFEDITITEGVDDILMAISFLKRKGYKKIGLIGSSFGGICSVLAASKSKDLFVLCLRAPVSNYFEVELRKHTKKGITAWKSKGFVMHEKKGGELLRLNYSFFRDIKKHDVYESAKKIKIPAFIVHGDADEIVPVTQSRKLIKYLKNGKIEVLEGANHRFEKKQDFNKSMKLLAKFVLLNTK